MIKNHYAHKLSDLDLEMARCVRPGENWKAIATHIPSKRLDQIRESFARGEGSRSTYYGRLHPDRPSYTISTYFSRPGNGCHLHYDYEGGQHRTLSQREAARLQTFPDAFEFLGSKNSVARQIGNAVPPALAYLIANLWGSTGQFLDLFCGAGGLSLGFQWAGWRHVASFDNDVDALETYRLNICERAFRLDLSEEGAWKHVVDAVHSHREGPGAPLILLGGPPCQGFSTAGNRRSMDDRRNHLFKSYAAVLSTLQPSAFIFENVPGLLNMQKGAILNQIISLLEASGYSIQQWLLNAEEFSIPQRRKRLFLVGSHKGSRPPEPPEALTYFGEKSLLQFRLPKVWSVRDALNDLPSISHAEDGSHLPYRKDPENAFQALMRGSLTPTSYFQSLQLRMVA